MSEIPERVRATAPRALAAAFAVSGVAHFLRPETFAWMVPRWLPAPSALVYASGAAELVCAAGLLLRRGWAGPASATLLLALLPAHFQMTADATERLKEPDATRADRALAVIAWVRIPLQIPLIWAALQNRPR